MALEIVQAGHPVLRQKAQPVDSSVIGTDKLDQLIAEMVETMRLAPGVGLAAPQVGLSMQLVVIEDQVPDDEEEDEYERTNVPLTVLINPTLEPVGDEKVTFHEGCLSVSGWAAETARHRRVRVRAVDQNGEPLDLNWKGWPARILQHEIDHLNGTLYVDRMDTRTFSTTDNLGRFDDDD